MTSPSILSQFSQLELEELITENPSLRGYLQGYLGELALRKRLQQMPNVLEIEKIPDKDPLKGDLRLLYRNELVTIEVKSLLSDSIRRDTLNDTWTGRVLAKNTDKRLVNLVGAGEVLTSSIIKGTFDILAICCYPVDSTWEFLFMDNIHLPEVSPLLPGLVKTSFLINPEVTPFVTKNLTDLLDSVVCNRLSKSVKIHG